VDPAEETSELLFVVISGGRFAFGTDGVAEVMNLVEPTAVPGWPDHGLGLVDLRGSLIPLLDVSQALARASSPLSVSQFIVVVHARAHLWGVLTDSVDGVRAATVRPFAGVNQAAVLGAASVCRGVVVEPQGTVVVLDPEALVTALALPSAAPV
jgi:purine-binding chemotaxis protein CheW